MAADQKNAIAQNALGSMYQNGEVVEAMLWYCKAADQGDAIALKNLRRLYRNGLRASQDRAKALLHLRYERLCSGFEKTHDKLNLL